MRQIFANAGRVQCNLSLALCHTEVITKQLSNTFRRFLLKNGHFLLKGHHFLLKKVACDVSIEAIAGTQAGVVFQSLIGNTDFLLWYTEGVRLPGNNYFLKKLIMQTDSLP